jgi:hypothetical protein
MYGARGESTNCILTVYSNITAVSVVGVHMLLSAIQ